MCVLCAQKREEKRYGNSRNVAECVQRSIKICACQDVFQRPKVRLCYKRVTQKRDSYSRKELHWKLLFSVNRVTSV